MYLTLSVIHNYNKHFTKLRQSFFTGLVFNFKKMLYQILFNPKFLDILFTAINLWLYFRIIYNNALIIPYPLQLTLYKYDTLIKLSHLISYQFILNISSVLFNVFAPMNNPRKFNEPSFIQKCFLIFELALCFN